MGEYVDINIAMETIEQAYNELLANAEKFKGYSQALLKNDAKDEKSRISLGTYKQVVEERDIALAQLKELGYEFGERTDDAIPRGNVAKIREVINDYFLIGMKSGYDCLVEIDKLVNSEE